MKINAGQNIVNIDELKEKLEQALPSYHFKKRGSKILVAKKSLLIGVVIVKKKKCLQVSGNFPEFYLSLLFAVFTVLLGIILPLVLHFIFIHRKLKKAEKEVAACLPTMLDNVS